MKENDHHIEDWVVCDDFRGLRHTTCLAISSEMFGGSVIFRNEAIICYNCEKVLPKGIALYFVLSFPNKQWALVKKYIGGEQNERRLL